MSAYNYLQTARSDQHLSIANTSTFNLSTDLVYPKFLFNLSNVLLNYADK